jgi:hypothetical protein
LSILLCATASAALKWEQTQIELRPALGDKEAVGHFKYQNAGDQPVRIKSVRTSCGCTAAQTQKDEIAPGESGEITATFKIGGRTGTQIKSVTVETDDPAQATTTLLLKAVIPQALEIKPTVVFWQMGEASKAKSVVVKANKDAPVTQLKVTPSSQDFETKVEKVREGEYRIDISPKDTSREMAARITILPENSRTPFFVTALVKKATVSSVAP